MICTFTFEPESPRATKRILLEKREMHIGGLVTDAPAGSDSEVLSDQGTKGVEVAEGQARPRPAEAGAAPIAIAIVPPTRPRTTTALTRRRKGFATEFTPSDNRSCPVQLLCSVSPRPKGRLPPLG